MDRSQEIVICGAGIAGISSAYYLAVKQGIRDVLLVDERDPLSLTSDKSTECYRNWWPDADMVALMSRSIDLLEGLADESGNSFQLNRRGYLYASGDPSKVPAIQDAAEEISRLGAGPLRVHAGRPGGPSYLPAPAEGYSGQPEGADLILDTGLLSRHFPYLTERAVAALHVRRAGWFSAQQLGVYLLEAARACGVRLLKARVTGVDGKGGRVRSVSLDDGRVIPTGSFVNAAGPFLKSAGEMTGASLPVFTEPHFKVALRDHLNIVPRDAPLLIWTDSQKLSWSDEERELLSDEEGLSWLLEELPAGVHARPEGGTGSQVLLMLWEYQTEAAEPVLPLPVDPIHPEVTLRGLATMIPGLRTYLEKASRPVVDGGYYTKTRQNRPLIGPLPLQGAFVIGALSGFGLMAACAAGELLAAHLVGSELPRYAPAFTLDRYQEPPDAAQPPLGQFGQL